MAAPTSKDEAKYGIGPGSSLGSGDLTGPKFNKKGILENGKGNPGAKTLRKNKAKHADLPTTAAADPKLQLPEALNQVDPQKLSQFLPNMYSQFMTMRNLMNSFNKGNSDTSNPGYMATSVTDVFTGALANLSKSFSFYYVLTVLFFTLSNGRYNLISTQFKDIVLNAIINLIKLAIQYGETNIPTSTIPQIVYGTKVPRPLYNSYSEVPDYYIQQYYTPENDPYPGYIEWKNPDTNVSIYVKRTSTDHPYNSAENEIFTTAEIEMSKELAPYFKNNNLTVDVLNNLLSKYCTQIQDNNLEKNMGKNSKNNILSLLSQLAGIAATIGNKSKSNHIPQSVLNKNIMSNIIDEHKNKIGQIKKLKSLASNSVLPMNLVNNIPAINSLTSLLNGSFSSSASSSSNSSQNIQQAQNIVSTIKKLI